jgi:hypothetical protein
VGLIEGVVVPDLGVSGPTRRYTLIVSMLMGLAAVPTAIVLGAGRAALDESDGLPSTTPLLGAGPPSTTIPDLGATGGSSGGAPAASSTARHRFPDPGPPPGSAVPAAGGDDESTGAQRPPKASYSVGGGQAGGGQAGSGGGGQTGGGQTGGSPQGRERPHHRHHGHQKQAEHRRRHCGQGQRHQHNPAVRRHHRQHRG